MARKSPKVVHAVRVEAESDTLLMSLARQRDETVSDIIRSALDLYLSIASPASH